MELDKISLGFKTNFTGLKRDLNNADKILNEFLKKQKKDYSNAGKQMGNSLVSGMVSGIKGSSNTFKTEGVKVGKSLATGIDQSIRGNQAMIQNTLKGSIRGSGKNIGNELAKDIQDSLQKPNNKIKLQKPELPKPELPDMKGIASEMGSMGSKMGESFGKMFSSSTKNLIEEAFKEVDDFLKKSYDFGKKGTLKISAPLFASGTAIAIDSSSFREEIGYMKGLSDSKDAEKMKAEVLKISKESGKKYKEVSDAYYRALSMSMEEDTMEDFLLAVFESSRAGRADPVGVAQAMSKIMKTYEIEQAESKKLADKIFLTTKYGDITQDEIAHHIGRILPSASSVGATEDEILAQMAALSQVMTAQQTATSLKGMYESIQKPSEDAKKIAEQIGVEFSMAEANRKGFTNFLVDIVNKAQGDQQILTDLFGPGGAAVLTLGGAQWEAYINSMLSISDAAGAVEEALEDVESPMRRISLAANDLRNTIMGRGEALDPIINSVADGIERVTEKVSNMSDEQIQSLVKIAGFAVVIFPTIQAVSFLGSKLLWVGEIGFKIGFGLIETFISIAGAAGLSGSGVVAGLLPILGTAGAVIAGVGLIGLTFSKMKDDSIADLDELGIESSIVANRVGSSLEIIAGGLGSFVLKTTDMVHGLIGSIGSSINNLIEQVSGIDLSSTKFGESVTSIYSKTGSLIDSGSSATSRMYQGGKSSFKRPQDKTLTALFKRGELKIGNRTIAYDERKLDPKTGMLKDSYIKYYTNEMKREQEDAAKREAEIKRKRVEEEQNRIKKKNQESQRELEKMLSGFNKVDLKDTDKAYRNLRKQMEENSKSNKKANKVMNKGKTAAEKKADEINRLSEAFLNTNRSLRESIGLFDRFKSRTLSSYKILRAAREQEKAFLERESILKSLEGKGLSEEMMNKLYSTNMNQLGALRGLDRMSLEQLKEWQEIQMNINKMTLKQSMDIVIRSEGDTVYNKRQSQEIGQEIYKKLEEQGVFAKL